MVLAMILLAPAWQAESVPLYRFAIRENVRAVSGVERLF
jgi:hypothetical protein